MDYTTTGNNIFVTMAAIIGLFLLVVMIFYIRAWLLDELDDYPKINTKSKKYETVISESVLLREIDKLNEEYNFYNLSKTYYYRHQCYSKSEFDRTDIYKVFVELVSNNPSKFQYIIEFVTENRTYYNDYLKKFNNLVEEYSYSSEIINKSKKLLQMQTKLVSEKLLNPVTDVEILVTVLYTSPQGRNSYSKHETYRLPSISYALKHPLKDKISKSFIDFERTKMTNSLRYDILKRDGFKCTICGATANEGAKLHVDHIKPVSKGGKTEPSNLRTLCEKCNSGKRDKYEEGGLN